MTNSEVIRDALCELVNIGSGSALTSLVELLGGGRLIPTVPQVIEAEFLSDCVDLQRSGVAIWLGVDGVVPCAMLAVFDDASARKIATALMGRPVAAIVPGSLEESSLLETANIISCAFLASLGNMVRGELIPSPPRVEYGVLHHAVLQHVGAATVVTTYFSDGEAGISGRILVLVDSQAAAKMARAVGVEV